MANTNLLIALFGGKEIRKKRLYSLTYDEYSSAYLSAMAKVCVFFMIVMVLIVLISTYSNDSSQSSESISPNVQSNEDKLAALKAIDDRYQLECNANSNTDACDQLLNKRDVALTDATTYTEDLIHDCQRTIKYYENYGYHGSAEEANAKIDIAKYRNDLASLNKGIVP